MGGGGTLGGHCVCVGGIVTFCALELGILYVCVCGGGGILCVLERHWGGGDFVCIGEAFCVCVCRGGGDIVCAEGEQRLCH